MDKQKILLIAAKKVLADWYTLASSLPQNDALEAMEWGAMHQLRNAVSAQGEPESWEPEIKTEAVAALREATQAIRDWINVHTASPAAPEAAKPVHDSDCSMHNEPAYPAGPCDCSLSIGVDGSCQRCNGTGCDACDARLVPASTAAPEATSGSLNFHDVLATELGVIQRAPEAAKPEQQEQELVKCSYCNGTGIDGELCSDGYHGGGNCHDCNGSGYFKAGSTAEQQAQAGEPEVVGKVTFRWGEQHCFFLKDLPEKTALITLQSHREAMAETEEMNRQLREQNEAVDAACAELEQAIAKKDAALLACVRVLNGGFDCSMEDYDAAITQAQEALK